MSASLSDVVGTDIHYKEAVTSLGNKQTITCSEDIYSDKGVKLVAKGVKIDSKVYANLVKHKLQKDFDENITIDDPITISIVISDIATLVSSSQTLSKLTNDMTEAVSIGDLLSTHTFPENIALKLTAVKSERKNLYNHSLTVLYLSYFLATKSGQNQETITMVLLAALFHDLGLLHLDPALFEKNKALTPDEIKFLHVHVIISDLLLTNHPDYQSGVSNAVIEHHERLDGSGYPTGKSSGQISVPGQILAITEVMASRFNNEAECADVKELSMLLTLNNKKLASEFYQHWQRLFNNEEPDNKTTENYSDSELIAQSLQLNKILKEWLSIVQRLPSSNLIEFIDSYIEAIHSNLLESGMNINDSNYLASVIEEDRTMSIFFHFHMKEYAWQLKNLLAELNRRKLFQRTQQDTQIGPWLNVVIQFSNIKTE
jgi:hypothetical protein